MLVADIHTCQRFRWGYIVLDEAHRVKNEKSLMGQASPHTLNPTP